MASSSLRAWTIAAGVALGVAYTASPLTVWFAVVMTGVFWWAGRGLTGPERRYVWGLLAAAVGIRVLAIAALFLASHPHVTASFFWDGDGVYLKHRAMAIRDVWSGIPISPVDFSNAFDRSYGWSSYLYVLAYLQYLTGPAPYGVHLFNVTMFVAAAVVMHRLARSAYGRAPALLGLALMLFLPTLIFWSVSALKEALYIFLCAVGLMGVVTAIRATRIAERLLGVVLLAGSIAANNTVRAGASVIMIAGIVSGLAGSIIVRRVALVLLVVVILPLAALRFWAHPDVQAEIMDQLKLSAVLHIGNVRTEGHPYKLLDQRFYSNNAIATMTPAEGLRFAIRALVSFVVVPLPWQIESRSEIVFLAQQVVWYILVVLAVAGLVAGLRRDALVTCLLAGLAVTGGAVIAINSGNIGSMVRFRDTIVPFVVWLSAVGAISTMSRIVSRGAASTSRAQSSGLPANDDRRSCVNNGSAPCL
jgi:hypothetical protein